jgi:hypothetical protein
LNERQVASAFLRLKGSLGGTVIYTRAFWSPDGQFLTFAEENWAGYDITASLIRIQVDGSNRTTMTSTSGTASLDLLGWR